MLFSAVNEHDAKKCPLKTDEGVKMLKEMFSEENMNKHNIKLEDAYLTCPKDESKVHKGFFKVSSRSKENVKKFFGKLKVDLKEVVPFSKVI